MFGVWGLREAAVDQPAHAAEPTRLCILGDLLDTEVTVLGGSPACSPDSPSRSADEDAPVRIDLVLPGADQPPAGVKLSARVPTGEQSSSRRVPARHSVGPARPPGGVDATVEAATSVVRPAVEELSRTGLLEPVGAVVRPVAEPIVDVLPPVLAPVLGLAQPILGPPAAPSPPPAGPVEIAPAPAGDAPAVGTPGPRTRPAAPLVAVSPGGPSPAPASTTAPHQEPSTKAGQTPQAPSSGDGSRPAGPVPGVPGAPASTAGSGSAAVGTGDPADATGRSWTPDLTRSGHHVRRCHELAGRSPQPDTRPA